MAMTQQELLAEMERLLEKGDEKALEAFTLEHFKEFPEDVQGKLLLSFYTEALEKEAGEPGIADIQQQGLDALKGIDAIKSAISSK